MSDPVDLSGYDRMPVPRPRGHEVIDLGPHPIKKLVNANRDHRPAWRWEKLRYWQAITRAAYVSGYEMPRAHIEITFYFADLRNRDVANIYMTTKGIVDGLVSKPDQFGWLSDDNDRIVVGPDPRRGLDRKLHKSQVRITVTLTELNANEGEWWNVPQSVSVTKTRQPRRKTATVPPGQIELPS